MAAPKTRPRKTIEDFMALGEEVRAELIDGELYVTPAPRLPHQGVVRRLLLVLDPQIERLGLGCLELSPMDVHLPSGDVVQPDLIFVSKANDSIRQDWIRGVPDLLIEVVSPTHPERDRFVKRRLYARNGVPAYWIVDLEEKSIEVLALEEGRYSPEAYFQGDSVLITPTLPDIEVPLTRVFE